MNNKDVNEIVDILRSTAPEFSKLLEIEEAIKEAMGEISTSESIWFAVSIIADFAKKMSLVGGYNSEDVMSSISAIVLDSLPSKDYIPHGDLIEIEEAI